MRYSTWLLQFEDHLIQAYQDENYAGTFPEFCNKLFEEYLKSEVI